MPSFLSLLFFLLLSSLCLAQQSLQNNPTRCADFKYGTYEMYYDSIRIEIKRFNDIQIEKTNAGEARYKIKWTSACAYNLQLFSTTLDFLKDNIGEKYSVTILSTEQDQYTYEVSIDGTDFKRKATLKKIR